VWRRRWLDDGRRIGCIARSTHHTLDVAIATSVLQLQQRVAQMRRFGRACRALLCRCRLGPLLRNPLQVMLAHEVSGCPGAREVRARGWALSTHISVRIEACAWKFAIKCRRWPAATSCTHANRSCQHRVQPQSHQPKHSKVQ